MGSKRIHYFQLGRNSCLWLQFRSVLSSFGVVLMSCRVKFADQVFIDPTFSGIFVCGALQSFVVNVCTTSMRGPTPVSTTLRKSVRFFLENGLNIFFQFPGMRNNNNIPPICKASSEDNGAGQYPVRRMTQKPR